MPLNAAPFTSLQDLPVCNESVLHEFPAIRYVLPVQLMTLEEMEVRATLCQEKSVEQDTRHPVPVTPVTAYVTQEHPGVLRLLMDVGGIIGLYFGFSVYVGVRHVLSSRWGRRMKGCERRAARWAAVVLVGVAAYTCYVQVHEYLFRRPVSVVTTSQPLQGAAPMSITLCPWPPVNTTRLMTFLDVDDGVLAGHLQKEQPAAALLDTFMGNTSLLVAAWEAAEWHVEDLVEQYYDGERFRTVRGGDLTWRTVAWAGRRCFTYTPTSYKQNYLTVMAAEDSDVRLQYTVHAAGEPPLLGEPVINELDSLGPRKKVLSALTTYHSLGQEHAPSLGDCYHRCTQAAAMAEAGCVPPPAGDPLAGSATHLFCNSSVARRLVLWALQNVSSGVPTPVELVANQMEACLFTCRRNPRTMLTMKVNGQEMTAPSITIHADIQFYFCKVNNLDALTLLTEYDAYPLANLLSDAGSLLGILLGISVLSVGKWLLGLLKETPLPQDTEAQGTTVQDTH